ncbi:thiamine pyrophosphate-binding protein [Georgenia deserti]|uniref:Thiamine pyrophosphate-binding protein n=1 Tax=Georgenia deserti TaxID=2093781 RepID=A0ABW4L460_9MICO
MPTVAAHVAATLAAHVDHVFGLMGNGNAHLLDTLERDTDVTFTAVRHEAGAVVAADAFHRACGELAVATATYGAGFTNMLTPLAEAVQARTPMVVVVGDEPTSGARPWDVDQISVAAGVGARTYTVARADAAATTAIAVEHARAGRRPVVLAIPYDVGALDAGPIPDLPPDRLPEPLAPTGPATEAALDLVAEELAAGQRPVLVAGRGAWLAGAGPALGRLAEVAGALTTSTALARGVFPDARYDLGVAGGFGAPGAMDLVQQADVALVVGASLNQFTMRFGELFGPTTRVIQVDLAPTATHARVGTYIRGDAALVAEALVQRLEGSVGRSAEPVQRQGPPWREAVDVGAARAQEVGEDVAPDGRLDPRRVAARIGELLPEDRVVVSDGGHFIGWANMYWPVAAPDRMIMVGTAYQAIGLGLPSVAGAAVARPGSTIVLTTGDGGGLMALADLETAVRVAGGRGLAVVWNDAAYGAEVNLYGRQGMADGPMRIPEVDFAGLAHAVGAEGVVVRDLADLDRLAAWAATPAGQRRFLLLDVRISADVVAPYQQEIIRANRPAHD